MGYYIDFVFDEGETFETVLHKLMTAGAIKDPDEEAENAHGIEFLYSPGGITVRKAEIGYRVTSGSSKVIIAVRVMKKESPQVKGNWADTRISWGADVELLKRFMDVVFHLAQQLGCRVYDGQIDSAKMWSRSPMRGCCGRKQKSSRIVWGAMPAKLFPAEFISIAFSSPNEQHSPLFLLWWATIHFGASEK